MLLTAFVESAFIMIVLKYAHRDIALCNSVTF